MDQRQRERLLEGLALGDGCNSTATPGLNPVVESLKDDEPLSTEAHIVFRAFAAWASYFEQDRVALKISAKSWVRLSVFSRPQRFTGPSGFDAMSLALW